MRVSKLGSHFYPHRTESAQLLYPSELHIVTQFYVDSSPKRQEEIEKCLYSNVANPHIRHIHLLTEKPMSALSFAPSR